jgi:hypothetical protein
MFSCLEAWLRVWQMTGEDRRVTCGFKFPPHTLPVQTEEAWISRLRAMVGASDPVLTPEAVPALRLA